MLNIVAVTLVLLGSFIGAIGTLIIKKGTNAHSFFRLFTSFYLWLGLGLFGCATIVYIIALRQAELSVLYPLVSTTYIWATLFSVKFLGEKMNPWKWAGLTGIIFGVVLIGIGS